MGSGHNSDGRVKSGRVAFSLGFIGQSPKKDEGPPAKTSGQDIKIVPNPQHPRALTLGKGPTRGRVEALDVFQGGNPVYANKGSERASAIDEGPTDPEQIAADIRRSLVCNPTVLKWFNNVVERLDAAAEKSRRKAPGESAVPLRELSVALVGEQRSGRTTFIARLTRYLYFRRAMNRQDTPSEDTPGLVADRKPFTVPPESMVEGAQGSLQYELSKHSNHVIVLENPGSMSADLFRVLRSVLDDNKLRPKDQQSVFVLVLEKGHTPNYSKLCSPSFYPFLDRHFGAEPLRFELLPPRDFATVLRVEVDAKNRPASDSTIHISPEIAEAVSASLIQRHAHPQRGAGFQAPELLGSRGLALDLAEHAYERCAARGATEIITDDFEGFDGARLSR